MILKMTLFVSWFPIKLRTYAFKIIIKSFKILFVTKDYFDRKFNEL